MGITFLHWGLHAWALYAVVGVALAFLTFKNKVVANYETWLFPADANDWFYPHTVEALTGYLQPIELSYLLDDYINTKHC